MIDLNPFTGQFEDKGKSTSVLDLRFAPIAEGVTNGDSHDHSGGDGAQIDHVNVANKGTNTHAQIDSALANVALGSMHITAITRYVLPGWFSNSASAPQLITANTLYYIPIFVSDTYTYVSIVLKVGTAVAASTARIGVYAWGGGLPTTLVVDSGTVDTSTTGNKEITADIVLTGPRFYFLAYISDAAISVNGLDAAQSFYAPVTGIGTTASQVPWKVVASVAGQTSVVASGFAQTAPTPTNITTIEYAPMRLKE